MDAGFLERLLGGGRVWAGPCVVILDASAAVKTPGPDSVVGGGQKSYAPRVATGRLAADSVLLMTAEKILLAVEQIHLKDQTGAAVVKQTLIVVDVAHVVGVEFDHTAALTALGVPPPPVDDEHDYRPGTLVG